MYIYIFTGKNGGKSKSKGIAPDSFHAKKLKSNFQPLASQILSAGKRKKAPLHGEIGSISPKRRPRRSKRKRKNEVITIDDDSSDNDSAQSEGQFLDDVSIQSLHLLYCSRISSPTSLYICCLIVPSCPSPL